MTIDLKNPKYVLPIILLPFVCLLFYGYKSSFGKQGIATIERKDSLQSGVASVSQQVRSQALANKLDVLRQNFSGSAGYSAINGIGAEAQGDSREGPPAYDEREKRVLDSIGHSLGNRYDYGRTSRGYAGATGGIPSVAVADLQGNYTEGDQAFKAVLAKINQPPPGRDRRQSGQPTDPMQLFRQQMALVDSMGKAADPELQAAARKARRQESALKRAREELPLTVSKTPTSLSIFNTVVAPQKESPITATIDQDMTAYAGSRLRIKLLEDIWVGTTRIIAGTFLYARVSGFSGQRVNLAVTSILQDGQILPVKLEVYDNDGLAGLYVPDSAFRDFTKALGEDAVDINPEEQSESNNQQIRSLLGKMFQSTTAAVSKLIRQNKAKLKYHTLVYLVDPAELHTHVKTSNP